MRVASTLEVPSKLENLKASGFNRIHPIDIQLHRVVCKSNALIFTMDCFITAHINYIDLLRPATLISLSI